MQAISDLCWSQNCRFVGAGRETSRNHWVQPPTAVWYVSATGLRHVSRKVEFLCHEFCWSASLIPGVPDLLLQVLHSFFCGCSIDAYALFCLEDYSSCFCLTVSFVRKFSQTKNMLPAGISCLLSEIRSRTTLFYSELPYSILFTGCFHIFAFQIYLEYTEWSLFVYFPLT